MQDERIKKNVAINLVSNLVVTNEILQAEVGFARAEVRREEVEEGGYALVNALVRFLRLEVSQGVLCVFAEQSFLIFPCKVGGKK